MATRPTNIRCGADATDATIMAIARYTHCFHDEEDYQGFSLFEYYGEEDAMLDVETGELPWNIENDPPDIDAMETALAMMRACNNYIDRARTQRTIEKSVALARTAAGLDPITEEQILEALYMLKGNSHYPVDDDFTEDGGSKAEEIDWRDSAWKKLLNDREKRR